MVPFIVCTRYEFIIICGVNMKDRRREESLITSSIFNFIKTFFNLIFPIVTFAYSTRVLGVDGIGKVNFTKAFTSYFMMIAMLGINYYGTREGAKLRDDISQFSKFACEMFIINLCATVFSLMMFVGLLISVSELENYRLLLIVNSVSIVLTAMGMEWVYQALEQYRYITIRTIIIQFISIVLMFVFVRDKEDVVNYTIISVIAGSGAYIINFAKCRQYLCFKQKLEIKKHLIPVFVLFAMALSIELYTVLDSVMLGFIKGDYSVGLYSAGLRINKIVNSLITSIGIVLLPRLSYYIKRNEFNKLNEVAKKVYQITFMLSIPASIGLFLLSDEIIMLFSGKEFLNASITMKLLTPIVIIIPFSIVTNMQIFIPMGKEKLILKSTCIGAITNFTLNLCLIPTYAENGAAIATVVAEFVVSCICFGNIRKYLNITEIFNKYYQYWIAALPILIIERFIDLLGLFSIFKIAVVVIISVLSYLFILKTKKNTFLIELFDILEYKLKFGKKKDMRK